MFIQNEYIMDNVVNKVYPNLINDHKQLLANSVESIIDYIASRYNFDKNNAQYLIRLKRNTNRDLKAILNMILPYVNENSDKTKIKNLNDLYVKKDENNEYIYTNLQYNRAIREKNKYKERQFNKEHLNNNLKLLMRSIHLSANKLYVNWIDIFPYSYPEVKDSVLYKKTKQLFRDKQFDKMIDPEDMNGGLPFDDIYNVLYNDLFNSVKNVKWLLYERVVDGEPMPFIEIINEIIDLTNMKNNVRWEHIDQTKFSNQWYDFLNKSVKKKYVKIFKGFFYAFQKYYNMATILADKKLFIPFKFNRDEENEVDANDFNEEFKTIDVKKIIPNIRITPPQHIYNYILSSIQQFKKTVYYDILNTEGHIIHRSGNYFLTLKNVYNFAKSLTHYNFEEDEDAKRQYYEIGKQWKAVPNYLKSLFLEKLERFTFPFGEDGIVFRWFSLKIYYQRLYGDTGSYYNWIRWVYKELKKRILDIIFRTLCKKGVLSYFMPRYKVKNRSDMKKYVFTEENKKKFGKAYYFVTGEQYKDLPKIDGKHYFLKLVEKHSYETWPTFYALDWVSQISFFHKYLNNRVIFVTGGTGVGKSSQVPKLLLYSTKALDYKMKGKVVCTQPRINATEKVAKRIAEEMGVPIENYNKVYKEKIITDNYYVQFKHGLDKHIEKVDYYMKMTTDGSLVNELTRSPLLKKSRKVRKEDGSIVNSFTNQNIYDIFIVDESHEHNTNMDIILTLIRYGIYYNNDTKLVIISATMDDDEPLYRRYFRMVNDNRMYPPDIYIEDQQLDRINVDRRIHISKPEETTRYNIQEIYDENVIDEWEDVFEKGLETVIKIGKTTNNGDILFFVTGLSDIEKAVQIINQNVPDNTICLPYYSAAPNYIKDVVENISSALHKFRQDKDNIMLDKYIVGEGMYNRVIIVATNVAEASLTIPSLKYVVDTGYSKVNVYDYKNRMMNLVIRKISESSRIQRRGRVGRVQDGIVYYIYGEGKRRNIKTEYKIINDGEFYTTMYKLLEDGSDLVMIPEKYDPNLVKNLKKDNIYENIDQNNDKNTMGIITLRKQYYVGTNELFVYYGNDEHHDWTFDYFNVRPPDFKLKGYDKDTLIDLKGIFYMVHPDEDKLNDVLKRDRILGYYNVVNSFNKDYSSYKSNKIITYFKILEEKLLITYTKRTNNYGYVNRGEEEAFVNNKRSYINNLPNKTNYGQKLYELYMSMGLRETLVPYLYGHHYDCSEEILNIICMLRVGGVKQWIEDKGKFMNMYENKYGDYICFLKIYRLLKNTLPELYDDIDFMKYYGEFESNLKLFNKGEYVKKDIYINLMKNGDNYDLYIEDKWKDIVAIMDLNKIEYICRAFYLKKKTVVEYLKYFIKVNYAVKYNQYKVQNIVKDDEMDILVDINWFINNVHINYKEDENINIILCFMHEYGANIGQVVNKNTIKNISNDNTLLIKNHTIKYLFEYVMYDTSGIIFDEPTALTINNVNMKWLYRTVPHIFKNKYILQKMYHYDELVNRNYYIDSM